MTVAPELATQIREIRANVHEKLFRELDFSVFDQMYAKDATIMPSGGPMVRGRDQILEYWKSFVASFGLRAVRLSPQRLEPFGERILEIGKGVLSLTDGKTLEIKYLVMWIQEDDTWKWYVDMWNPRD